MLLLTWRTSIHSLTLGIKHSVLLLCCIILVPVVVCCKLQSDAIQKQTKDPIFQIMYMCHEAPQISPFIGSFPQSHKENVTISNSFSFHSSLFFDTDSRCMIPVSYDTLNLNLDRYCIATIMKSRCKRVAAISLFAVHSLSITIKWVLSIGIITSTVSHRVVASGVSSSSQFQHSKTVKFLTSPPTSNK